MTTQTLTNRSRFTLRVAAAITGNDPWAQGYAEYHGTARSLRTQMPQISQIHGGNIVSQWYHHGQPIDASSVQFVGA